ncbi:MAG: 30S ribosomal protein S15 [Pseudomonadota bacterium]|nr:30S ribosomal protein S15 [Pseudomonadota bacterium]
MITKTELINEHKLHENDKGSTPVQIAILTERIIHLTKHFKTNPKDNHSRHGLLQIIRNREKLLKYYKKTKTEQYYELITKLGIRDKKLA